MIADADSDLCSETVNESLITWLIEYNRPGCKPPTVWRPRPKNEAEIEDQKAKKADRESKQLGNLFNLAAKGLRPATGIEQAVSDITGEEYVFDEEMANGPKFTVNAPTAFTRGFTASGGNGATAEIDGSVKVSKNVEAGETVTAGQEVSAPILRGTVTK